VFDPPEPLYGRGIASRGSKFGPRPPGVNVGLAVAGGAVRTLPGVALASWGGVGPVASWGWVMVERSCGAQRAE
jgi:hypothetical protein